MGGVDSMGFESILVSKGLPHAEFSRKGIIDAHRSITSHNKLSRLPRRHLVCAGFSAAAFAAMMSGYVQSPLGNSEHGENRFNESHTGHAEGRVE